MWNPVSFNFSNPSLQLPAFVSALSLHSYANTGLHSFIFILSFEKTFSEHKLIFNVLILFHVGQEGGPNQTKQTNKRHAILFCDKGVVYRLYDQPIACADLRNGNKTKKVVSDQIDNQSLD